VGAGEKVSGSYCTEALKSAQMYLQTGKYIRVFSKVINLKLTPIEDFSSLFWAIKLEKAPDFFRNPVLFTKAATNTYKTNLHSFRIPQPTTQSESFKHNLHSTFFCSFFFSHMFGIIFL